MFQGDIDRKKSFKGHPIPISPSVFSLLSIHKKVQTLEGKIFFEFEHHILHFFPSSLPHYFFEAENNTQNNTKNVTFGGYAA